MLTIEIIRFETRDIIASSCACIPGDQTCARNGHPGCDANPPEGHLCGLGEE